MHADTPVTGLKKPALRKICAKDQEKSEVTTNACIFMYRCIVGGGVYAKRCMLQGRWKQISICLACIVAGCSMRTELGKHVTCAWASFSSNYWSGGYQVCWTCSAVPVLWCLRGTSVNLFVILVQVILWHAPPSRIQLPILRTVVSLFVGWITIINEVYMYFHNFEFLQNIRKFIPYTDLPMAGGSKKATLRKLHAKIDLDEEKGEVTTNAYMYM